MDIKKILQVVASLLLAAGLMWFVFKDQDLTKVWIEAKKTNLFWLGLAAFASLLSHWSRAHRWKLIIEPLITNQLNGNDKPDGFQSSKVSIPSTFQTFSAVVTGYAVNYAIPRLGEITRCGMLYKSNNLPVTQGVGTVVAERILDLLSLAALAVLTFIIEFDQLMVFITQMQSKATGQNSQNSNLLIWFMVGFVISVIFLWIFRNRITKMPLTAKIVELFRGLIDGALSVTKVKNGGIVIFHSIFIWLMYYFAMYFAMLAFPETSHLGANVALAMLLISSLGMIIPVPGGLGAYHYLVSNGLFFYGVSLGGGVIFALISHSLQMIEILLLTGVVLSISSVATKKTNELSQ